jgi:hypothetical protein
LTKIKQWWLPVDAESYLALREAGVPLVRFHVDFLPALSLITKKHRIRAKEVSFKDEILTPFLNLVGTTWNKKQHCRATIAARSMKFETLKPEVYTKAKESITKLTDILEKFFVRWGFKYQFEYSESRGKCKLNVEYYFDSTKMPVIPLETPVTDLPKVQLKIGFTRITMTFGDRYVDTLIEVSQGGKFTPLHSTRCTYSQISSVKPMIAALMQVPDHDIHNFDNSATP